MRCPYDVDGECSSSYCGFDRGYDEATGRPYKCGVRDYWDKRLARSASKRKFFVEDVGWFWEYHGKPYPSDIRRGI